MRNILTLILITISTLGVYSSNAQIKIGFVSADEIIASMPEAARVDTQLNQYQQSLYQNAQEKNTTFQEAVAKFYKDSATMTASLKEVKRKDLQQQAADIGGEEQRIQALFEQKRQELSLPIQKRLTTAIQDVAKENGYTYVLPREALLVMPPSDDIGGLVRKKLGLGAAVPKANTPVRK